MITEEQAAKYEASRMSLGMSFIYDWFPALFSSMCRRHYKRYVSFIEYLNSNQP